jgi:hypothetical protein
MLTSYLRRRRLHPNMVASRSQHGDILRIRAAIETACKVDTRRLQLPKVRRLR